jgi:small subunit ribosomal protein S14
MAKKSMIERDRKRTRLITKYAAKREHLLVEIKNASSLEEKF